MKNLYNIEQLLKQAGLSPSERRVYLAAATTPHTSAELVGLTKMPRATVLGALKSLINHGLCLTTKRDGRSLIYKMQPLSELKSYIGQRIRQMDELVDTLNQISETRGSNLEVKEVKGQAAVQDLLELALNCKSRHWHIIAPHSNALAFLPKSYTNHFKQTRQRRQIESQTLWEAGNRGQQISMRDLVMRKPRYVPKSISQKIPSLILAFDDCLLAIDGTVDPSAFLVKNQSIADTFRLIFEMAWLSANKG